MEKAGELAKKIAEKLLKKVVEKVHCCLHCDGDICGGWWRVWLCQVVVYKSLRQI